MQIQKSAQQPQPLAQTFKSIVADGKVTQTEYQDLKKMVDGMKVSGKDKAALLQIVDRIKDFTSTSLTNDGILEYKEMAKLKDLAKNLDSSVATDFLTSFEAKAKPKENNSFLGSIFKSIASLFGGGKLGGPTQNLTQSMSSAPFNPTQGSPSFPKPSLPSTQGRDVPTPTPSLGATSKYAPSPMIRDGNHVCQGQGPRSEAQSNCGPAAAAMIMKQLGITPPSSLTDLRKMVGAPTAKNPHRGSKLAISQGELMNAVRKQGGKAGKNVQASSHKLPNDPKQALQAMQERLDRGEKVVLLTGNMHTGSTGHYVVVKQINPDGSLLIDDPGRAAPAGENRPCSFSQFRNAMKTRGNAHMMCFK